VDSVNLTSECQKTLNPLSQPRRTNPSAVAGESAKHRCFYKIYDQNFPERATMNERLTGAFDVILSDFSELQGTYMTKAHIFHSLVCALLQNRFGLPGAEAATGISPTNAYFQRRESALASLKRLAAAHEEKDETEFGEYVKAASESGNRAAQRATRVKWLCRALQGEFA
jgi:hypothetical protein